MMLKKEIKFKDLDDNEVTEIWYFNLSKSELAEMALRHGGAENLQTLLRNMIEAKDGNAIVDNFKAILLAAVGRRSEDGRRLIKTQEVKDEFLFSGAYNELFMEVLTDTAKCVAFIQAIVPADLNDGAIEQVTKEMKIDLPAQDVPQLSPQNLTSKDRPKTLADYTAAELLAMPADELDRLRRLASSPFGV